MRKEHTVCPFCKEYVLVRYSWKNDSYSCGCYNPNCKLNPATRYVDTVEEAEKEWESAFKD